MLLTQKTLKLKKEMNQVHRMSQLKSLKRKLKEILVQMMIELKLKNGNSRILLHLKMMILRKKRNVKRDRLVQVQMYV